MEIHTIGISAFVTIFSAGLLIISLLSYKKHRNKKLLFVSLVFFILLIHGILLSLGLFYDEFTVWTSPPYVGLFDLIILISLFIATLKR